MSLCNAESNTNAVWVMGRYQLLCTILIRDIKLLLVGWYLDAHFAVSAPIRLQVW